MSKVTLLKKASLIFVSSMLFLVISVYGLFYFFAGMQGVPDSFWKNFSLAKVVKDEMGIPTVTAKNWDKLIEAQGFVVASERLWQMDLMRRKAQGRLSEWFGEKALRFDKERKTFGWQITADKASKLLNGVDKKYCDLYAKGINQFINDFDNKWSIEYKILNEIPEPWECRDSISIMMLMGEELSSSMKREVNQAFWKSKLSNEWFEFLFPTEHPDNDPFFGIHSGKKLEFPLKKSWLPESSVPKSLDIENMFY